MRVLRDDGASGTYANTVFVDGEAHTDNAGALAYFRRRDGYTVVDPTPAPTRGGGRRKAKDPEDNDEE